MGTYRRKFCLDTETSKTRIVVWVESQNSRFVVRRQGTERTWRGIGNSSPISEIEPLPKFQTEQEAIAFADDFVANHYSNNVHFHECPLAPDDEFPRSSVPL
jgi:hypothetical protein